MDASGPIPFLAAHAARLYGGARPARPIGATVAAGSTTSQGVPPAKAPAGTAPVQQAVRTNVLVAGKVEKPVDPFAPLETNAAGATSAGFALYTRAADRVEVATAVAIGRNIDRKG